VEANEGKRGLLACTKKSWANKVREIANGIAKGARNSFAIPVPTGSFIHGVGTVGRGQHVTFTRARVIGSGPSACRLGEAYGSQGDKRCSGAAGDFGDGGARPSGGMLNRCPRSNVGEHMPDPRITTCVLGPAAIAPSSFSIWNPLSLPAAAVVAVLARHGSEHVKHHAIDGGKHALGELARCRCAQPKMAGALQSCTRLSRRRSGRSRPCGRKGGR